MLNHKVKVKITNDKITTVLLLTNPCSSLFCRFKYEFLFIIHNSIYCMHKDKTVNLF